MSPLRRGLGGLLVAAATGCGTGSSEAEPSARSAPPQPWSAPAAGANPVGVDGALWQEVGWFPTPIFSLAEFTHHDSAAVIAWLRTLAPDNDACRRALAGADHYFVVTAHAPKKSAGATGGSEPTHVVYGTSSRTDVEACAVTLPLGTVQVSPDGWLSAVESPRGTMWLGFATVGEQTAIIADRDRATVERFATASERFDGASPLHTALVHADRTADTWSVSLHDVTSPVIDVPCSVHAIALHGIAPGAETAVRVHAWARFDSPADAVAARTNVQALASRFEVAKPGAATVAARVSETETDVVMTASGESLGAVAGLYAMAIGAR